MTESLEDLRFTFSKEGISEKVSVLPHLIENGGRMIYNIPRPMGAGSSPYSRRISIHKGLISRAWQSQ
jgi:hypothetical protein